MSPAHTARNSRKKEIPEAFILNWQCPGTQGAKPLVRRPMTACEACRMAKVKCNGKQECERCSSRGEICRYTSANREHRISHQKNIRESTTASNRKTAKQFSSSSSTNHNSPLNPESQRNLQIQADIGPYLSPESSGEVSIDLIEPFHMEIATDISHAETNGSVVNLPNNMFHQAMEKFDWESLVDINRNPMTMHSQPHSESLGSLSDIDTTSFLSLDGQHNYSPSINPRSCHCQAKMMLRVPDVKGVMDEKPEPRLDKVFKVTGDMIQSCHDIIKCASCEISHADLVCIMAVFQHTDQCFDYIAKCDLATACIQVSVGEYHVSLMNDLKLRRMLVMDLVQKARDLLSSLSSLGQKLLLSHPGASRLNKINLEYLQKVVQNSENYLRKITSSFDNETPS
ncbi:hypothetical protein UA08_08057 [Talaromyces atroroseus]|uniref:Zn(2)-C6 fungal-type domain-containing protein n=1 Tax=Talaromyces atroroseus TaxID=1441469 RepID=A0A225AC52_TALAT|nr:hypothetical protein UA08_08057 [Talaromyces atroroseus]OKL56413.1 hypothetical protein UA08_08057 [Talaromyces atroroseus]